MYRVALYVSHACMTVFPALVQLRVQLGEVYRVLYSHLDMMFFPQLAEFKNNSI